MHNNDISDTESDRAVQQNNTIIPSRKDLFLFLKTAKQSITLKKIIASFTLKTTEQHEAVAGRLRAMCQDSQLTGTPEKGYKLPKSYALLEGKVVGNRENFGFVIPNDGSSNLFLSPYQMRQVFPNDEVLVVVSKNVNRSKREASIIEIVSRHTQQLIGTFVQNKETAIVKPSDPRIHQTVSVPKEYQAKAKSNQIVSVEIIEQPKKRRLPIGKITTILGDRTTQGIETLMAIQAHQLPNEWPIAVRKELNALQKTANLNHLLDRKDLRQLPFVTIDGEDSKDFDDAVYCVPKKKDWQLYVAIADVSQYVKSGTALDKEAEVRGNSVYFVDQVIPMLPELLSNDLCSLKPHIERNCLVCEMQISTKGAIKSYQFYPATICSKARLTYNQVTDYLKTGEYSKEYQELLPSLSNLHALYEVLISAREKRGAIDLDLPEAHIVLDDNGKISDIQSKNRTIAHRIIEECMLIANVSAAQFLLNYNVPSLFRVHEAPSPEKIADFKQFVHSLGLRFGSWLRRTPKPADFAKLLTQSNDENHQLIQAMMLRTMSQALYSPTNKGHFGLAYAEYTHFTSPIRRYPDLIVHRAIYHALTQSKATQSSHHDIKSLNHIGVHCSMTERRADIASRQVMNTLKCHFIQTHLGNRYTGKISHITSFGFFVELQENLVEGLVHIHSLTDDHYIFEQKNMILKGKREGKVYRLAEKVTVQVKQVDIEKNIIDFKLCD